MIIGVIQFVIAAFGMLCLYCEVSDRYRNCNWHVSIRWVLMMSSIILAYKVTVFATAPILAQIFLLFGTLLSAKILYRKVLSKQIRIKGFKLRKPYIGDRYEKSTNR